MGAWVWSSAGAISEVWGRDDGIWIWQLGTRSKGGQRVQVVVKTKGEFLIFWTAVYSDLKSRSYHRAGCDGQASQILLTYWLSCLSRTHSFRTSRCVPPYLPRTEGWGSLVRHHDAIVSSATEADERQPCNPRTRSPRLRPASQTLSAYSRISCIALRGIPVPCRHVHTPEELWRELLDRRSHVVASRSIRE